jgi:tetratricopeptide (TPR) repeat protein
VSVLGNFSFPAAVILLAAASIAAGQAADSNLLKRYYQEGERALAEKRYAEAAKAYEQLRQHDPSSAEVHARLGLIYFQGGEFARAVPVLRQALKLKPGLANVDVLLAMSVNELGRYAEAVPGLEKGFRQTADAAIRRMAGLQLQRAYTGLQQDSKAVAVALELSRAYPEDPEVLYHAGQLFGNFAYLTMRKLSEVAPESIWTIQSIGEAQESQGAYDLAINRYRQVAALDPKRPGIHFRIGRALTLRAQQNKGAATDSAEALQEFEKELALDPTNANAAYESGVAYYRLAQFEKAGESFAAALKHYPDFQEAEVGLGRTLLALRKPDKAAEHLRKAVSLNSRDEVAFYHLSRAHRELGNAAEEQKAMAEFRRLRADRSRQEALLAQRTVTKQEIDSDAQQQ